MSPLSSALAWTDIALRNTQACLRGRSAIWVIYKTLMFGEPVQGYPTLMVVILFLGGVQLMNLGLIGEYVGRMFDEAKRRPLYVLESYEKSHGLQREHVAQRSSTAVARDS